MLGFLFRGLTGEAGHGAALFDSLTREARQPHWYVEGKVPDTIDGRFAVLTTVLAMALARLEQAGPAGNQPSVALTERFTAVMESEHRELGLGDPALGKTVRKLVGALGRRTALWRSAAAGNGDWTETVRNSLFGTGAAPESLAHCAGSLKRLWARLERTSLEELEQGELQ